MNAVKGSSRLNVPAGGAGSRHSVWPNVALALAATTMLGLAATAAWQHGATPLSAPAAAPRPGLNSSTAPGGMLQAGGTPAPAFVQPSATPSATASAEPRAGGWRTPPNLLQEESR